MIRDNDTAAQPGSWRVQRMWVVTATQIDRGKMRVAAPSPFLPPLPYQVHVISHFELQHSTLQSSTVTRQISDLNFHWTLVYLDRTPRPQDLTHQELMGWMFLLTREHWNCLLVWRDEVLQADTLTFLGWIGGFGSVLTNVGLQGFWGKANSWGRCCESLIINRFIFTN